MKMGFKVLFVAFCLAETVSTFLSTFGFRALVDAALLLWDAICGEDLALETSLDLAGEE